MQSLDSWHRQTVAVIVDQGSLNGTNSVEGIKQCKYMLILKGFPYISLTKKRIVWGLVISLSPVKIIMFFVVFFCGGDIDDEQIRCFWAKVTEVVLPPYILFIICFCSPYQMVGFERSSG